MTQRFCASKAVALCSLALAACGGGGSALPGVSDGSPASERQLPSLAEAGLPTPEIRLDIVEVPEHVNSVKTLFWLPDSRHLMAVVRSDSEFEGEQIGIIDVLAGEPNLKCLTCGWENPAPTLFEVTFDTAIDVLRLAGVGGLVDTVASSALRINPFGPIRVGPDIHAGKPLPDGKRFIYWNTTGATATGQRDFFVAECSPSMLQCDDLDIKRLYLFGYGGIQDRALHVGVDYLNADGSQRDPTIFYTKVTFEGWYMVATKIELLETPLGAIYVPRDQHVINSVPRRQLLDFKVKDWLNFTSFFEMKTIFDAGTALYGSNAVADNIDNFELDLHTGEVRRIVSGPEWEEDLGLDASGRYFVSHSAAAGDGFYRTNGLIGKPGLFSAAHLLSFGSLQNNNDALSAANWQLLMLERKGQDAGAQPALLFREQLPRGVQPRASWSPDGKHLALGSLEPDGRGILHLATFPQFEQIDFCAVNDCVSDSLELIKQWAQPIEGFLPLGLEQFVTDAVGLNGRYTLTGEGSGVVHYTRIGNDIAGRFGTEYVNYEADKGRVLNGVSEYNHGGLFGDSCYIVDLQISDTDGNPIGEAKAHMLYQTSSGVGCGLSFTRVGDEFSELNWDASDWPAACAAAGDNPPVCCDPETDLSNPCDIPGVASPFAE